TAFKQQRLRSWQPLLTPKTVLPTFFIIGILFVPIGAILYWQSSKLFEYSINYTRCAELGSEFTVVPSDLYEGSFPHKQKSDEAPFMKYNRAENTCSLKFTIPINVDGPIFMYYRLTKFYQNHRKYVSSYDTAQLKGTARSASDLNNGNCDPLATRTINGITKPIYPCGLIANSVFN
ncbi:hypothetical protein BB560_004745, partial [Smittium megazygosporum]